MFKSLLEISKQLFGFAADTQKNKEDIKTLQTDSADNTDVLKQIIFELQRLKGNEAHEREKLALRMLLAMKDNEQRTLPPDAASQDVIANILARLEVLERQVAELKKP